MLDLISLIRYIFIYWLKNPAAFKDEFWCVFLNLWCILISISFQIVRATVPGNHLVEYSMCTGNDPTPFFYLPSFGRGYIESFSLIIQIIVYIKIWLYKIKARKAIGPQGYSSYLKNIFINDLDKQSLTGVAPDIALGLSIASGSVLIVVVNFKSCQDFQMFPKFLVVYYTYIFAPCIFSILFVVLWFMKNAELRETILRELKSIFVQSEVSHWARTF